MSLQLILKLPSWKTVRGDRIADAIGHPMEDLRFLLKEPRRIDGRGHSWWRVEDVKRFVDAREASRAELLAQQANAKQDPRIAQCAAQYFGRIGMVDGLTFTANIVSQAVPYPRDSLCGVYFLIRDGVIVYVGQSIDVLGRIASHRSSGVTFDSYHVEHCPADRLDAIESWYIYILQPENNGRRRGQMVAPVPLHRLIKTEEGYAQ